MKIVADNKIPFLKGVLEPYAQVVYLPGAKIAKTDLADADGLIVRTRTKCNRALLEGTKVKFIATATIGFDHIDTNYCESNGINWTNAAGCNSASVAQYIASAILHLSVENRIRLSDLTIGIVGVGNVGSKVAKFAKTIGMKVLLNDPPRARKEGDEASFVTLKKIMDEADIITFHVPLTDKGQDKTFHIANGDFFGSLRKKPWLFNSSRGEVMDTSAVKGALKTGKIAGAVIDVWENEPNMDLELLELAKFATPHIAGYSTDGKANGTSMSVHALAKFFGIKELKNWYPRQIPEPALTEIKIDGKGKTKEQILLEAVKSTYDIRDDDSRLRASPGTFEKQREEYPLRREFGIFEIKLAEDKENLSAVLSSLGFEMHT